MQSINLIPKAIQRSIARRDRAMKWGVVNIIAVLLLSVPVVMDWSDSATAAELQTQNRHLRDSLHIARARLASTSMRADETLMRLERTEALRKKRRWSGLIAMIGNALPQDSWLESIATDPSSPSGARGRKTGGDAPLDGQSVMLTLDAPRSLVITGLTTVAADPHTFALALKQTKAFTDVVLESSQSEMKEQTRRFRFELRCTW